MVTANLWKIENDTYSIQFNKVRPKEKKLIFKLLSDWKETASGFHSDGSELLIFSKKVMSNENIYKSLKELPFPLVEEKKSGELKSVKTQYKDTKTSKGLTMPKKSAKIGGGRTCSRCGNKGHNSRTCKDVVS